ncbi:hypothetical protein H2201_006592 [Coniosporium apollinis]|uniref:Major facilitator superfamily (MFS) profile domain-containing protein n=2 Tax=Coniosporium TaxID=2810619 RepID=A0ABQ9NLD6_9PEZI|nr:hypothetical protein H2199_000145 [Cladosporium sp. JES 115]KAJ9661233.1 hypothetical protein H2201_006592 [Coniosporium apollinis]
MDARRRSSVVNVDREDDGVLRVNDEAFRKMSVVNPDIANLHQGAQSATQTEHEMTIRDALKLYPKAVMFSVAFSTAVVMEGYDLSLTGSFFGFPPFKNRYGTEPDPENPGELVIGAAWQSGISNGVQVGSILGLYLNGYISDIIGYKKTMVLSLIVMICFLFIPFFAPNIGVLVAGAVLQGIPWGIFQTLTVTYASEICPVALRAYLTTYVNLCWVIGQFIAAGVLRGFLERDDQWAYRIPYALQWVWPVAILPFAILAPESPWWLVRKGREEDAKKSLLALTKRGTNVPFDVDAQVAMIRATNELERAMAESTSYLQCFRGIDGRRTEIASMTWVIQAFCGAALMGYSVQFYQQAGLPDTDVFNLNLGQYAMGAVGTIGSWFLMPHVGRRTIYIAGLVVMLILLLAVGFAGIPERASNGTNKGASWAIGSLLLIYTFVYDFTVGPVCYSLVAEIPSTRLKIKTVVLARNFYNIGGIINNIIMPRMLLPTEWNWGPFTGFFWAGVNALLLTWCFFRLPEPKGRTYAELDVLFENRVSARKFAKTKVDQFAGQHTEIVDDFDEKPKVVQHSFVH